jgi:signal transduction histidine kinase
VVRGREAYFIQLFQNLVDNAIKYRNEHKPEIHISAVQTTKEWEVSVTDNGIGIPPNYREHVFEIFKRLQEKDIPGTGLGLALCRRVVERSGGRIWADSDGDGCTFRFTIPVADEAPQPA